MTKIHLTSMHVMLIRVTSFAFSMPTSMAEEGKVT